MELKSAVAVEAWEATQPFADQSASIQVSSQADIEVRILHFTGVRKPRKLVTKMVISELGNEWARVQITTLGVSENEITAGWRSFLAERYGIAK